MVQGSEFLGFLVSLGLEPGVMYHSTSPEAEAGKLQ